MEADDENSMENEDDLLQLMDGIAIHSQRIQEKVYRTRKSQSIRNHKQHRAERNLLDNNNYREIISTKNFLDFRDNDFKPLLKWREAYAKVRKIKDPWRNFDLNNILPERVERYIFNAFSGSWLAPVEGYVKIESKPFNHGAMRECFRLKKMSSLFKESNDWNRASNYVAKRYMEKVSDNVYYEDVILQMDAKLWGQEYSRQPGVIKKVDICQMSIIKFVDRPEQPLFHLEHFIEGDYVKYNSNSGFVDEHHRNTPHAFSHFTFERSGHKLIVVDIQGVGDLYTDPQIHTFSKTDYGDGNLGPRGMALFFHSHVCNSICTTLGLKKFDLSESELAARNLGISQITNCGTVALHSSIKVKSIFEENNSTDVDQILLNRLNCDKSPELSTDESSVEKSCSIDSDLKLCAPEDGDDEGSECMNKDIYRRHRLRSSEISNVNEENSKQYFIKKSMVHRPSCISNNLSGQEQTKDRECILGEIHHELARLHSCGKLLGSNSNINWEAILYHEEAAAKLGFLEAICNMSRLYLNIERDSLFESYPFKVKENDFQKGLEYMKMAAELGDRRSMIFLGQYFKKDSQVLDWEEAYKWYERAVSSVDNKDESGCFDSVYDIPLFEIEARMAEMKFIGGHNLNQDLEDAYVLYSQAANDATVAGMGRLAAKYFTLADEILSQLNKE